MHAVRTHSLALLGAALSLAACGDPGNAPPPDATASVATTDAAEPDATTAQVPTRASDSRASYAALAPDAPEGASPRTSGSEGSASSAPKPAGGARSQPAAPTLGPPGNPGELLARPSQAPDQLDRWARDADLEPEVRYTALRELEAHDPERAVSSALALIDAEASFVRLNALALLAKSDDPRAAEALAGLDARSQRLAAALAARR